MGKEEAFRDIGNADKFSGYFHSPNKYTVDAKCAK
jgi:hypothetical protein